MTKAHFLFFFLPVARPVPQYCLSGGQASALTCVQLDLLKRKISDSGDDNNSRIERFNAFLSQHNDAIHGKDGVSQGQFRKYARCGAKAIFSTKEFGMALARIDLYNVAPIVLGGVYYLASIVEGATDQKLIAIDAALELTTKIALWTSIEERQIRTNKNSILKPIYLDLSEGLIVLYKSMIVLMGQLVEYLESHSSKLQFW